MNMNFFDYLFAGKKEYDKELLIAPEKVKYRGVHDNAVILSRKIRELAGKNKEIILISPNNEYFITSYLAIIRSGNICVPLNSSIEKENLNFILEQTEAELVFIDNSIVSRHKFDESVRVLTSKDLEFESFKDLPEIDDQTGADDLAEIIYTSGSTGKPKGVMITHQNLIANTDSILAYLPIRSDDTILIFLPFFYCYGLSLLHTHIKAGASIVLNNSFFFLGKVIEDLTKYKCNTFAGVPSHFQLLLRKSKTFKTLNLPDLRYVTQAGGNLPRVFIEEFRESFPEISFYVMYGQTEATARLTYLEPDEFPKRKGSIGKAIPGVEIKIAGKKGDELAENEVGELIATGKNIMKGYYKDAGETSRTIKNGWLFTGDLGKMDQDGYLYLTGRMKQMIKVGGNRISPKEIEEVILTLPEVIDCTIKGKTDNILGESIMANVVIDKDRKISEEDIITHCKKSLVSYKVPHTVEISYAMSVNSAGKKTARI